MNFEHTTLRRLAVSCLALAAAPAFASNLTVSVTDAAGQPLADAVVYAEALAPGPQKPPRDAVIEQKGRKFLPMVTVVQTGASITFPNNDTVRHHIYSFSPAKSFEQKLYSGVPEKPVRFDKGGTVVLGCNIHDQMVAYVQVVDTPHFAKSGADGKARIDGLPAGGYRLKAWHHLLPPGQATAQQNHSQTASDGGASFKLATLPRVEERKSSAVDY